MSRPHIDWECGDIIVGDECRHLTPQQTAILKALTERPGKPVSMEKLIWTLWGNDPDGGPQDANGVVRAQLWQMRKKLPWTIRVRYGYGYSIEDYEQPARARVASTLDL